MRKTILLSALAAAILIPAGANAGGMGATGAFMREKVANCEKQRRGELPAYPSQCLPELPVTPVYSEERHRR